MTNTRAVAAAMLSSLLLAACADNEPPETPDSEITGVPFTEFGHVHGVGTNPADNSVYIAAHAGLFRLDGETGTRIAGRFQDTMGFTVVGPDTFLGSGHPDLREDRPSQLGLIRSADAGETWQDVSLSGEADLHALDTVEDLIVAYDVSSERVMSTTDGSTWTTLATADVIDLAVAPDGAIWVIDGAGRVATVSDGQLRAAAGDVPPVVALDITATGVLVAATPEGVVYTSVDGAVWTQVGTAGTGIQALDVADRWLLVSGNAVHESGDQGRTWTVLLAGDKG